MTTSEEITFAGSTGERLAGTVHLPEGEVEGSILLAPSATGDCRPRPPPADGRRGRDPLGGVPVGEGQTLFAAAAQPKTFVPLHLGADHLLTDRVTAGRAVETLVAWLRSTLDGAGPSAGGDQRPDQ